MRVDRSLRIAALLLVVYPVASSPAPRVRFAARPAAEEPAGISYHGARHRLDEARFASPDPKEIQFQDLADPQRLNRYAYGRQSPTVHVDPDGRAAMLTVGVATVVVAVGVVVLMGTIARVRTSVASRTEPLAAAEAVPGAPAVPRRRRGGSMPPTAASPAGIASKTSPGTVGTKGSVLVRRKDPGGRIVEITSAPSDAPVSVLGSTRPHEGFKLTLAFAVNNFDAATLDGTKKLRGLGEKTAETIVEEREANGPYRSLDDLERRLEDVRNINRLANEWKEALPWD
jgi:hypothetical protein